MELSAQMIEIIDLFLQQLPKHYSFDLNDEYAKFRSELLKTNEGQLIHRVSELAQTEILKTFQDHRYTTLNDAGKTILSKPGLAARKYGHIDWQNKLEDIEASEWLNASLVKRQVQDYDKVDKRSRSAICWSAAATLLAALALILLLIQWICSKQS